MSDYKLFTIGYEGRNIDEFVSLLKENSITRLIDVREVPLSRKKGFSKSRLNERLQNENIEYVHIKALGSPTEIRKKLKTDWNYKSFFKAFSVYLHQNWWAIENAYQYLSNGVNCIMCFESHPFQCHRSTVADKIKEHDGNELKIEHIQ